MYAVGMVRTANTRESLIEGTRQLLWDRGYLGTSPSAILHCSGVGQGSMYHHFQGKPDLVLAAEKRSAEDMQARIKDAFALDGTPLERITAYLLQEREVLRGCSIGRLASDPEVVADPRLLEPVKETFAVLRDCLSHAITEAQEAGELARDLHPEQIAATLSAVIQGGYVLARGEQSVEPFDRAVNGAVALLRASARETA
jgi:TetR/AcrR family transcriptional repressor of nem operon